MKQSKWREEWERKRRGCCREAATGLLCGAWRRLIIQLIMIRLFPAGTAALEMESLCSHTPQWKQWGMVPCRWDVCTHTYTHIQTHTHKHKQVCNVINTTCTHCAYSHTLILVYRAKNTHNRHSHHSSHVASHLYIPPNTNINLYLSPSLLIVQCYTHIHTQMSTDSRDHTHTCRHTHTQTSTQRKYYTSILRFSFSPRTHQNIMWILSIKFAPTEPSYLYLLQNLFLKGSIGVFNHKSEEIYIQRQLRIAKR